MTIPRPPAAVADRLWMLALSVGLPLLAMALLGQDSNWDLRNYHLYNPHAWLTGRMAIDIAPAQQQSWHNPLLDVPLYLIVRSGLPAGWASLWLTLPYIAALYCLLRLQHLLSPSSPTRVGQASLALLGISGAATYSTLGLSMNDGYVAAAMLGSLLLFLRAPGGDAGKRGVVLAGLLAGLMAGLKLSAAFYCVALACATLVSAAGLREPRRLAWLAAGGIAGFLLSYGYWGWLQWTMHGNPFFPYFNNLFQSPEALPQSYNDLRFRPASVGDGLLAPWRLLRRSQHYSELILSDPRLLLGILGFGALWLFHRRQLLAEPVLRARLAATAVFFVTAFLMWIFQYGIYRYAIVLELLGALAVVLLVQRLPRGASLGLVLAVLAVSADTRRPNWGHDASPAPHAGMAPFAVTADAMVVTASQEPLAYLALGLPNGVPMVAVLNNFMSPLQCTGLQVRAQQRIARHRGPIWLLNDTGPDSGKSRPLLARHYGLQVAGACRPLANSLAPAQLCPLRRAPATNPISCAGQARP